MIIQISFYFIFLFIFLIKSLFSDCSFIQEKKIDDLKLQLQSVLDEVLETKESALIQEDLQLLREMMSQKSLNEMNFIYVLKNLQEKLAFMPSQQSKLLSAMNPLLSEMKAIHANNVEVQEMIKNLEEISSRSVGKAEQPREQELKWNQSASSSLKRPTSAKSVVRSPSSTDLIKEPLPKSSIVSSAVASKKVSSPAPQPISMPTVGGGSAEPSLSPSLPQRGISPAKAARSQDKAQDNTPQPLQQIRPQPTVFERKPHGDNSILNEDLSRSNHPSIHPSSLEESLVTGTHVGSASQTESIPKSNQAIAQELEKKLRDQMKLYYFNHRSASNQNEVFGKKMRDFLSLQGEYSPLDIQLHYPKALKNIPDRNSFSFYQIDFSDLKSIQKLSQEVISKFEEGKKMVAVMVQHNLHYFVLLIEKDQFQIRLIDPQPLNSDQQKKYRSFSGWSPLLSSFNKLTQERGIASKNKFNEIEFVFPTPLKESEVDDASLSFFYAYASAKEGFQGYLRVHQWLQKDNPTYDQGINFKELDGVLLEKKEIPSENYKKLKDIFRNETLNLFIESFKKPSNKI